MHVIKPPLCKSDKLSLKQFELHDERCNHKYFSDFDMFQSICKHLDMKVERLKAQKVPSVEPISQSKPVKMLLEEEVPTSSASWSGTLTSLLNTPLRSRLQLP
jgi:hypothetical protein